MEIRSSQLAAFARGPWVGLATLLLLAIVHIVITWGHIDVLMWRDVGRWLHEVDRFSQGELPYRDYVWVYPPLSLWLIGGIARMFGSHVTVIWLVTSSVFLLVCVVYYRYASILVRPRFLLPVSLSGFLLSVAYANYWSAPLPTGTYSPAAPVGFLFLLTAVILTLRGMRSPNRQLMVGIGFFCGLCILTKQDFWPPALYIIALSGLVGYLSDRHRDWVLPVLLWSTFLVTTLAGMAPVIATAGWAELPGVFSGQGNAFEVRGFGFPSWQRITIEIVTLGALATLVYLVLLLSGIVRLRQSYRWLLFFAVAALAGSALHVTMDYRASGRVLASVMEMRHSLLLHVFPALLPVSLALLLAVRWRALPQDATRVSLMFLVGVCIAARIKYGFWHVAWYHFLLETPVYAAALQLFLPERSVQGRRAFAGAVAGLCALGVYTHWYFGVGPMTRRADLVSLATPRGTIYVSEPVSRQFLELHDALRRADPGGTRPLFSFGYSGSFNYFLARDNPTPLTAGFRTSNFPAEEVINRIITHHPRPFLLDDARFKKGRIFSPHLSLRRWRLATVLNFYMRVDRPYFEDLLAKCPDLVAEIPTEGVAQFALYDCK